MFLLSYLPYSYIIFCSLYPPYYYSQIYTCSYFPIFQTLTPFILNIFVLRSIYDQCSYWTFLSLHTLTSSVLFILNTFVPWSIHFLTIISSFILVPRSVPFLRSRLPYTFITSILSYPTYFCSQVHTCSNLY